MFVLCIFIPLDLVVSSSILEIESLHQAEAFFCWKRGEERGQLEKPTKNWSDNIKRLLFLCTHVLHINSS